MKTRNLRALHVHRARLHCQTGRMWIYGSWLPTATAYTSHTNDRCTASTLTRSVTNAPRLLRPWTRIVALHSTRGRCVLNIHRHSRAVRERDRRFRMGVRWRVPSSSLISFSYVPEWWAWFAFARKPAATGAASVNEPACPSLGVACVREAWW